VEHANADSARFRSAIRRDFSIASNLYTHALPLASDLESALREFAAAGPAELRDNGARVAPALDSRFSLRK